MYSASLLNQYVNLRNLYPFQTSQTSNSSGFRVRSFYIAEVKDEERSHIIMFLKHHFF